MNILPFNLFKRQLYSIDTWFNSYFWFSFSVLKHINLLGLFNVKAILIEQL